MVQLIQYMHSTRFHLITVKLSVCPWSHASQQMHKTSSTSINGHTDTSDHGPSQPFKVPGALANGLTGKKNELVKCRAAVLSVPTDRNIQGWGRENVRAVPRYLLVDIGLYSYERFALFCCGKLTLRLVQAFYMPPLHRIVCAYRPVSVILYCIVPPAWFVQLCTTLPTSVLMQYTSYLLTRVSTLVPRDPEY